MDAEQVEQVQGRHGDQPDRREGSLSSFTLSEEVMDYVHSKHNKGARRKRHERLVRIMKKTVEENFRPENYADSEAMEGCNTNNHDKTFAELLETFIAQDCQRVFFEIFAFLGWGVNDIIDAMGNLSHYGCARINHQPYETPPALRKHDPRCWQNPELAEWQRTWIQSYLSEGGDSNNADLEGNISAGDEEEPSPAQEDVPSDGEDPEDGGHLGSEDEEAQEQDAPVAGFPAEEAAEGGEPSDSDEAEAEVDDPAGEVPVDAEAQEHEDLSNSAGEQGEEERGAEEEVDQPELEMEDGQGEGSPPDVGSAPGQGEGNAANDGEGALPDLGSAAGQGEGAPPGVGSGAGQLSIIRLDVSPHDLVDIAQREQPTVIKLLLVFGRTYLNDWATMDEMVLLRVLSRLPSLQTMRIGFSTLICSALVLPTALPSLSPANDSGEELFFHSVTHIEVTQLPVPICFLRRFPRLECLEWYLQDDLISHCKDWNDTVIYESFGASNIIEPGMPKIDIPASAVWDLIPTLQYIVMIDGNFKLSYPRGSPVTITKLRSE